LVAMWTPTLVLIAITTLAACVTLGGGLYEFLVIDPAWPKRPGIIQPRNGGVSRARFWLPAHLVFEVLLIVTLVVAWGEADVRIALLVALVSHAVSGSGRWSTSCPRPSPSRRPTRQPSTRRPRCGGPVAACCACRSTSSRVRRCSWRWRGIAESRSHPCHIGDRWVLGHHVGS
jgi:hypothetical protein